MGATSAAVELSFSTMRRVKAWLRSFMKQKRFNSLAILNFHKDMIHEITFVKIEIYLFKVMKIDLDNSGHLTPMVTCELFIFILSPHASSL